MRLRDIQSLELHKTSCRDATTLLAHWVVIERDRTAVFGVRQSQDKLWNALATTRLRQAARLR